MEGQNVRLYTYTMTADTGFAPNPYQGMLTLATCKPTLRQAVNEGEWISGWCGSTLSEKNNGKLVYLAKVEKKIPFSEYFTDAKYQAKKSPVSKEEYDAFWSASPLERKSIVKDLYEKYGVSIFGDNIYDADGSQALSVWHDRGDAEHDLDGEFVLVCSEFYYFGHEDNCLDIPSDVMPNVVKRNFCRNLSDKADKFVSFVKENAGKTSVTATEVKSAPSCSSVCNSVCNH